MKKLLFALTALFLIAFSASAQKQNRKQTKECCSVAAKNYHRIIMQLATDDVNAHKSLINQLTAVKEAWGDSVDINVVVHGPGVDFLMTEKTTQKENIYKVKKSGVKFFVCENTLKQKKISKEQILAEMDFVKFGLVEIVTKQEQGWTYLKAGF
jgi:intracellular sulfur oxidation DsrE/DsrF family protein